MTEKTTPAKKKAPVVLDIRKGSKLSSGGREYVVLRLVDLNLVLARESARRLVIDSVGEVFNVVAVDPACP